MESGRNCPREEKLNRHACRKKYIFHNLWAEGTPVTQEPLLGEFGYLVVGENTQKVLMGEYEPSLRLDKYVEKLLSFLKMHNAIRKAPPVSMV